MLLAIALIFLLVLIAVRKCRPAAGAKSAGGEGQVVYEEIDEGIVAASDPTYMEVGEVEGAIELKDNAAYGTHGGAESAPSAGGEGQVEVQSKGGEAPTYVNIGEGSGNTMMELKNNEAYGIFK